MARGPFVDYSAENHLIRKYISRLRVRTPSFEQRAGLLSGGNQQKVLLAKWLAVQPTVLTVDEPTRGVDIGTKAEIYALFDGERFPNFGIWVETHFAPFGPVLPATSHLPYFAD
ncbi:MAG TPA: ATP-binding cassette domain-containing protein [Chthoniobacterales bacterium]